MSLRKVTALLVFLAVLAGPLQAAESGTAKPGTVIYPHAPKPGLAGKADPLNGAGGTGASLFPLIGYVVIFALGAGAVIMLIRRGTVGRPFKKSEGLLQIRESRMLGNRQFLVVVEYEDNKMLLGVGPGRIDYLSPLSTFPTPEPGGSHEPALPFDRNE